MGLSANKSLKTFFIWMFILFVAVIFISQVLFSAFFETYDFPGRILSISFVWFITCVFHYRLINTVVKKPKAFFKFFMMQTLLKLLLYLSGIVIYLIFYKTHAAPFLLVFLVAYSVFSIIEVVSIVNFVKADTGQTPGKTKYQTDSHEVSENIH